MLELTTQKALSKPHYKQTGKRPFFLFIYLFIFYQFKVFFLTLESKLCSIRSVDAVLVVSLWRFKTLYLFCTEQAYTLIKNHTRKCKNNIVNIFPSMKYDMIWPS